jgi:hypothetical protein
MAQTVMNAFSIARNNDLSDFTRNFSWERHCQLDIETFQNPVGIEWQKNLDHLRLSINNHQSTSINFRFLEYKQKFHVDAEVVRRISQTSDTEKTARRDALHEVANALGLGAAENQDQYKPSTGLRNLFAIDKDLYAFLCSRPKDDKWKAILRNDHVKIEKSHIKEWTNLAGALCDDIWVIRTILRKHSPLWDLNIRNFHVNRDTANGVRYKTEEREAWKWAGSQWVDVKSAFEFKTRIGNNPYPGVAERAPAGVLGPQSEPGLAEPYGFVGNLGSLKSYAVTTMEICGVPTMVSGVYLKEADYLGTVLGTLHLQSDDGHGHEHCIEGPEGVHRESVPSPL